MRIVFTDDGIYAYALGAPSANGGSERQQWLLARALAASRWTVTVGVTKGIQTGQRRLIDNVEFVGIGPGRGHVLEAWHRFLSAERPEWWYWRSADHVLGLGVELARLTGVRTIFATAFDSDVNPRRALTRRRFLSPLYAWGLARVDRILVQHGGQFTHLAPQWRSKAHIVPSIAGMTKAAKSHSERPKYVAWVGMLRQPKRPDLLVEIAQKMPGIHFVVCGAPTSHRSPPGYGEQIAEKLRALPNLEYLGQVAPDKAAQVIADAAMLLSTSDGEGFPNTFLQAWSTGTPVVSLKIDPDNIIEQNGLGMVSRTVERAAGEIQSLADSPQERDAMGIRACRYIEKHHSDAAVSAVFKHALQAKHP